jgi:hypothetical protein
MDKSALRPGLMPPWPKGQSGNPSGRTRTMKRTEEAIADFTRIRGKTPSANDLMSLRTLGKLTAQLEKPGLTPAENTKLSNAIRRERKLLKMVENDPLPRAKRRSGMEIMSMWPEGKT